MDEPETTYSVTMTVVVTLAGLPIEHDRRAIFDEVRSRVSVGEPDDMDVVDIVEVIDPPMTDEQITEARWTEAERLSHLP